MTACRLFIFIAMGWLVLGASRPAIACPKCKAGILAELQALQITPLALEPAAPTTAPAMGMVPHGEAECPDCAILAQSSKPQPLLFSFAAGMDVTSAYYHRGLNMGDQGLILQPFATISLPEIEVGKVWIRPYVGTWNSFQEGRRGHGVAPPEASASASRGRIISETPGVPRGPFPRHYTGDPSHDAAYLDQLNEFFGGEVSTSSPNAGWGWYETQLYGGGLIGFGPATLDLKYTAYLYPGGDVASYQEISGKFSLETVQWLPKSRITPQSLRPYAELAYQVAGSDGHDMYLELGLEPTWMLPIGDKLLGISTPVLAGLSLSDYYLDVNGNNETLGYLSAGVKLSLRLLSSPAGDVYLNASVNYLRLESDLLVLANDGRQDAVVGTLGMSFSK